MSVRISTNMAALRATSDFTRVERDSQNRRAKLASGLAVNSGRDGGARLAISEGMRAEIGGLTEGSRNAEKALDMLRTAEGAMGEISSMLMRMRELAVESSSETMSDSNRESLEAEFNQVKDFIDRTSRLATYNDERLLSGFGNQVDAEASTAVFDSASTGVKYVKLSGADAGTYSFIDDQDDRTITLGNGVVTQTLDFGVRSVDGKVATGTTMVLDFDRLGIQVELAGAGVDGTDGSYADGDLDGHALVIESGVGGSFQLGSDSIPADRLEYDIADMTVDGATINLAQVSLGTRDSARSAISRIDQAINHLSRERGSVGAVMNRLTYTLNFTSNSLEGIHASESTVRDADFAWEASKLARNEILTQASVAMVLQSSVPVNIVMGLLQ